MPKMKHIFDIGRHKKTKNMEEGKSAKNICEQCKNIEEQCKILSKAARELKVYIKREENAVNLFLDGNANASTPIKSELEKYHKDICDSFNSINESITAINTLPQQ